jgi:hypothetical protein
LRTWRTGAIVGLVVCLLAAAVRGATLDVQRVGATSQGYLYIQFDLSFQGKTLDAIRSGLPTTLTFTLEIWRQRAGWWDRLEATRETSLRVLRDLLNDQYVVATAEEVRRFPDLESVVRAVCHDRREYLQPLAPEKTYYVILNANLAPLSVDDLKELERWLQGTIRAGPDESPGRIAGISGTMVGLLMSVTGFGDETVSARSHSFVPRELQRVAPRDAGGDSIAGGAAADSGAGGAKRP